MELINENKIGVTKGTVVEEDINMNFKGETAEVGLYLAMAKQAQREGYAEIAEVLKRIAQEEADHAARYAELNGKIATTEENLRDMLEGEIAANKSKKEAATKAKQNDIDEAHDVFDETSRDEARHAKMLKGLLERYFKDGQ